MERHSFTDRLSLRLFQVAVEASKPESVTEGYLSKGGVFSFSKATSRQCLHWTRKVTTRTRKVVARKVKPMER